MTTTMTTIQYALKFAGDLASHLNGLGYRVIGQTVYTDTRREALMLARLVLGHEMTEFRTEDGTYCYRDRAAFDADSTGDLAQAVISREEE